MAKPFFTVVIPTHNRSALLQEAIQSVLGQTFETFELIVVDDHSSDDTSEVVRSIQDNRIKYIVNNRSKGGAGARNSGIFQAKGIWVAFLDDDDVWLPNKLESDYKKIQQVDYSVGLVYSGSEAYDFTKMRGSPTLVPTIEGWVQKDLLYKNYVGTFSRVAIRTDLLKSIGGLDERFVSLQDRELFVRIAGISKVAFTNETLVRMRTSNADRITMNYRKRLIGSIMFSEKYKDLINDNPLLRHRSASLVFVFALKQRNVKQLLSALPWTFAGLFVDIRNIIWVSRTIYRELRSKVGV